jgi:protease I
MKRAVLVIPHENFRDEELFETKKALEEAGIEVKVASTELSAAKGKLGGVAEPDIMLADINMDNFDALVFIGGLGCLVYWDDPLAHKLLNDSFSSGKITAGICSSVVTLAKAGILKEKRATVYPGDSKELIDRGINYTASEVEEDGNIITASGPKAAYDFGKKIACALKEGEGKC